MEEKPAPSRSARADGFVTGRIVPSPGIGTWTGATSVWGLECSATDAQGHIAVPWRVPPPVERCGSPPVLGDELGQAELRLLRLVDR